MGYETEGPAKASQTRDAWIRGGVEKPRGGVLTGKCHAQVGILQEEKGRSPAQKHGPGYARRLLVCLLKEIAQRELVDVIWYYCWWDYLGDQTKSEQSAKLNHLGGSQAKLESISPSKCSKIAQTSVALMLARKFLNCSNFVLLSAAGPDDLGKSCGQRWQKAETAQ